MLGTDFADTTDKSFGKLSFERNHVGIATALLWIDVSKFNSTTSRRYPSIVQETTKYFTRLSDRPGLGGEVFRTRGGGGHVEFE